MVLLATERSLGTIQEEKEISSQSRFVFYGDMT